MLLRFRASNFASIRDEQEVSLVALDDHADLATAAVPLSKERVLPVAGIFGPNASGKSNLIKAMTFGRTAIVESHQRWLPEDPIPRWPFRLDRESTSAPSEFVFEFVHDRVRYEYGFSLNDSMILEEWLFAWRRGRRAVMFDRSGMDIDFGSSLTGPKAAIAELVRENSLFLSAAAANNHPLLRSVAAWFGRWQRISPGPYTYPVSTGPLGEQTVNLLRYADIGVIGGALVERPADEIERSLGWAGRGRQDESPGAAVPKETLRLELVHQAQTDSGGEPLPWVWESSGTQAWWRVSRLALSCLNEGQILTIDDLGGDLHPLLTAQLVGLFQDPRTNPRGAQLIFTGHDVNLLGRHVEYRLRRDQVWLTAKDAGGATKIYPLTEYGRVRDGVDDVEGRYLQGRYGAVPFFDRSLIEDLLKEPASDGA
ncbi:AAA family ATPase [Paractinoplanes ferrugineus]|uniref:AAA family ATPase n=1 Tax=Paractinoplanes ferrugineus TaxID=113564 RepID=UPI001942BAD9|nr:ATP-binding protein [Actinoplanes ferrugineus]